MRGIVIASHDRRSSESIYVSYCWTFVMILNNRLYVDVCMCAKQSYMYLPTFASSLSVKRKRKLSCESIPSYNTRIYTLVRRQGNFCACAKNLCIITEWHRSVYLLNEILLRVTLRMACYYYLLVTV